jgi:mRNA-degrading endonuclease RelE of RelBE toxin-antitoxin system
MRLRYTERFRKSYDDASPAIQQAFDRKAVFLEQNLTHPSLHAKKYDEHRGIWQARVNNDWRFYFSIIDDCYQLLDIMKHPK